MIQVVFLVNGSYAFAGSGSSYESVDTVSVDFPVNKDLFETDSPIDLVLKFDITRFTEEKPDKEYMDAQISYHLTKRDSVTRQIRLRARGNYRYRTCSFPPIRVNFTRSDINDSEITSIKNMKLVTHCTDEEVYSDWLLKEYLVYRIYNILTDFSFRVRLVRINYVDTGLKKLNFTRWAFIIEPMDMLLARSGLNEVEKENLTFADLAPALAERLALFECMIGNSDWSVEVVHNLKLLSDNDSKGLIPVPYDFDYSGFVNTSYAIGREDLGIKNIRDRVYLGPCPAGQAIDLALHDMELQKKQILHLLNRFKYLEYEERRDIKSYINSFYLLIRRDEIVDLILRNCSTLTN